MTVKELLSAYYEHRDEDARFATRHGSVEFLTTLRYIDRYLFPGARILEIGAGTGRYSHALARRGYQVDAVELVEHNIGVFRANTLPGEPVTVTQGDALDLSFLPREQYDITLLLGPLYHLFTAEDQRRALTEALAVTRPGGVVFAAYCNNDATVIQFCFGRGMLREPRYRELVDPVSFRCASTPEELFALHRREDVDALMEDLAVERLHYVGTDMAAGFMPAVVDGMDDELFERFMAYHFFICERPDLVGATNHMLDIFRKK